jgi:hypothetical protein
VQTRSVFGYTRAITAKFVVDAASYHVDIRADIGGERGDSQVLDRCPALAADLGARPYQALSGMYPAPFPLLVEADRFTQQHDPRPKPTGPGLTTQIVDDQPVRLKSA